MEKAFTSRNNFKGFAEAIGTLLEEDEDITPTEVQFNIIPPDLDALTDNEEGDEDEKGGLQDLD